MDAVALARIAALEARCVAAELRLSALETLQRLNAQIAEAETGERLELSDRLADVEAVMFPPAPPEQPA